MACLCPAMTGAAWLLALLAMTASLAALFTGCPCPLNSTNSGHRRRPAVQPLAGAHAGAGAQGAGGGNHPLALHRERRDRAAWLGEGAGAARRRSAVFEFLDHRGLPRRPLSGPAVAVRRRARPRPRALLSAGAMAAIGGIARLIVADIALNLAPRTPPISATAASRVSACRRRRSGRPRQGGRGLPPVAVSAADDIAIAAFPGRRRRRSTPTPSSSARSNGPGAQPVTASREDDPVEAWRERLLDAFPLAGFPGGSPMSGSSTPGSPQSRHHARRAQLFVAGIKTLLLFLREDARLHHRVHLRAATIHVQVARTARG